VCQAGCLSVLIRCLVQSAPRRPRKHQSIESGKAGKAGKAMLVPASVVPMQECTAVNGLLTMLTVPRPGTSAHP
jgi:hypothetical protein